MEIKGKSVNLRQISRNHPIWTEGLKKKNEERPWDLWDDIKKSNNTGVSEGRKEVEEQKNQNWKFYVVVERLILTHSRSSENPKQEKFKESHTQTYHNQTDKKDKDSWKQPEKNNISQRWKIIWMAVYFLSEVMETRRLWGNF